MGIRAHRVGPGAAGAELQAAVDEHVSDAVAVAGSARAGNAAKPGRPDHGDPLFPRLSTARSESARSGGPECGSPVQVEVEELVSWRTRSKLIPVTVM